MAKEPFGEALKEEYIGYGGRIPFEMIEHLRTEISKFTSKDKVQLKKQVFTAYFKQINKACKQLAKWNVIVSDDDIVIHIINQMYESDWFSKDTMTNWEEIPDNNKTWSRCQQFF